MTRLLSRKQNPTMAPAVVNRLPIISNLLKWFKGDDLVIDNALFKLHHQVKKTLIK